MSTGGEQGLLGLAFDPGYATNGRFVVHYTDTCGQHPGFDLCTIGAAIPTWPTPHRNSSCSAAEQPFDNHNGGQLLFGPDGLLYLGLGDGRGRAAIRMAAGRPSRICWDRS